MVRVELLERQWPLVLRSAYRLLTRYTMTGRPTGIADSNLVQAPLLPQGYCTAVSSDIPARRLSCSVLSGTRKIRSLLFDGSPTDAHEALSMPVLVNLSRGEVESFKAIFLGSFRRSILRRHNVSAVLEPLDQIESQERSYGTVGYITFISDTKSGLLDGTTRGCGHNTNLSRSEASLLESRRTVSGSMGTRSPFCSCRIQSESRDTVFINR